MIQLGAFLKTAIYLISSSLLYPTLALLLVSFLWVVLDAGRFCAEWLERGRLNGPSPDKLPELILERRETGALPHRVRAYLARLRQLPADPGTAGFQAGHLIEDARLRMWKGLDRLRILIRVAPSLGLIGTLIPMGTGLAALGQGDMTRLSSDLVIAFTTTVVGLAVGITAFFLHTVKRRWVEEDLKNLEMAADLLADPTGAGR